MLYPQDEQAFQFDRPSQHGLAPKTFADGAAVESPEAVEAIADWVRDEILRHVDAGDVLAGGAS